LKKLLVSLMRATGLANLPVRSRKGLIAGARWTLYPFSSYWRGITDRESIAWVDRFCRPGGAALDLGAHFGLFTVAMAQRVGPTGQVVSLEPDDEARAKCLRHVRMNHLDQVRVFPHAASSFNGTLSLVSDGGAGSSTSFVTSDAEKGAATPCVRLDDLYAAEGLRPPQFIKVDVENHGAEALSGAHALLSAGPGILMSIHSEEELAGTRAILEALGYHAFSLSGERVAWERALYTTSILSPLEDPSLVGAQGQG
jgi:FkbM family methyltransferase